MKKTMRYLIGAFGLAWILQVLAGLLFRQGNSLAYSALLSGSMFAPLLAAAVSSPGLRQMGWRPCIRKKCWLAVGRLVFTGRSGNRRGRSLLLAYARGMGYLVCLCLGLVGGRGDAANGKQRIVHAGICRNQSRFGRNLCAVY